MGEPVQIVARAVDDEVRQGRELVAQVDEKAAHALGAEPDDPLLVERALPGIASCLGRGDEDALDLGQQRVRRDRPRDMRRHADLGRAAAVALAVVRGQRGEARARRAPLLRMAAAAA